jgi:hypothetical protein
VTINVVDGDRRLTRIEGQCFASAPTEFDQVFNCDCYFRFKVNGGQHEGSGILSFFWNRDYFHRVMRPSSKAVASAKESR